MSIVYGESSQDTFYFEKKLLFSRKEAKAAGIRYAPCLKLVKKIPISTSGAWHFKLLRQPYQLHFSELCQPVLFSFAWSVHFHTVNIINGITISQALEIMNSGATFDLTAVTCSIPRGTGGRRIELKHCKKKGSSHSTKANGTITVRESHRRDYDVSLHIALIEKINGRELL